jgi:FKBP-type peptidyl-prolyl cis-trans isomerase FkpA
MLHNYNKINMTKIRSLFLAVSCVALLASCGNSAYKKMPSGIMYKIFSTGSGPVAKRGEILKFNYYRKLNDSMMENTFNSMPTYAKVDSVGNMYSPVEVFPLLKKGDSVLVVLLADTILKKVQPGQPVPFKKGDKFTFVIKVLDVLKGDEAAQADQMKEVALESKREVTTIENYLSSKNITTQKTPKGVFVVVKTPGDGPAVDSGKYVSIAYTGRSFPTEKGKDEKVFETNVGKAPFQFVINTGSVIPGWDEGLKMLKKGGKATFYIPASLAYAQQVGPSGKPYENLIFDVEVLNVEDKAPAPAPNPQMPPQQMPQQDTTGRK